MKPSAHRSPNAASSNSNATDAREFAPFSPPDAAAASQHRAPAHDARGSGDRGQYRMCQTASRALSPSVDDDVCKVMLGVK